MLFYVKGVSTIDIGNISVGGGGGVTICKALKKLKFSATLLFKKMPILRIWAFCAALYSPKFYFPTTVDCCFPHTVDTPVRGRKTEEGFFFPPRNREKTRPCCVCGLCCVCGSAICPAHHQESLRGDLAPVRVYVYIYTPKIKPSVCEHAVTG